MLVCVLAQGIMFVAYEYMGGGDLRTALAKRHQHQQQRSADGLDAGGGGAGDSLHWYHR